MKTMFTLTYSLFTNRIEKLISIKHMTSCIHGMKECVVLNLKKIITFQTVTVRK